mgnify:CR=1 FL=1
MSYSMDDDFMLSLFGEAGESSKTDNDLPAFPGGPALAWLPAAP